MPDDGCEFRPRNSANEMLYSLASFVTTYMVSLLLIESSQLYVL